MKNRMPLPLSYVLVGVVLSSGVAIKAEAQSRYHVPFGFRNQSKTELRHSYRPRIKVVRSSGSRALKSGQTLRYEFYVPRGGVARIEVRSGYRVVKTIDVAGRVSGSGSLTLRASDLRAVSGKNTFRLWAWQSLPGYQTIRGESIGYTLKD